MPDGDLRHLAEVEEISIGFTRPDGSTGSTPGWVVQGGRRDLGVVDPRPARRLVPAAGCQPDGEVGDGAHIYPVRARPVEDAGIVAAVTGAQAAKDGDSPYVGPLLTEGAADVTLRLEPRPQDVRGRRPTLS